jgi:hypothetical protein
MECDQNLGLIEKANKITDRQILVQQEWETTVAKAGKKFIVGQKNQDSITLEELKRFSKDSVTGYNGSILQHKSHGHFSTKKT